MSIDISTQYGSLKLRSPVVVGACPMTAEEQTRIAMASAGAGAIVLPSLFEEQIIQWNERQDNSVSAREEIDGKATRRLPVKAVFSSAEQYLAEVSRASTQLSIPVIASLSGSDAGNWSDFPGRLEEAGAAAIELNTCEPNPSDYDGPREMEDAIVDFVKTIDKGITIPLYLKLHRQFTSVGHLARRLLSGIQGLALFGRLPQVDICLDKPSLQTDWGLTAPGAIIESINSIMQVHRFCPAISLAATGGIGTPNDLIKVLLAGADVGMISSAVYRDGADVIRTMIDGLTVYMESHHLQSISELRATGPLRLDSREERADYIRTVSSRPLASEIAGSGERIIHGDRWGHRTT